MSDEARTLRRRMDELTAMAGPGVDALSANPTALVITQVVANYPTAAQSMYAVIRASVSGPEIEGSAVVYAGHGGVFYAANIGAAVPPQGSAHLATLTQGRWVFRYDG